LSRALLSVNVNKYALIRNSRGRDVPNLLECADTCLNSGAHGITIHPRMDQRHICFDDVPTLSDHMLANHPGVELNIECQNHPFLIEMVLAHKPAQCTLVPVTPGEVTSDHGFDFPREGPALAPTIHRLKAAGIRVSVFMDCTPENMAGAAETGVDRVELYTGPYAWAFGTDRQAAETERVWASAQAARDLGMGVNAGHDLDRFNLPAIAAMPGLDEVSIGHAQIVRALDVGTGQSIGELLTALGH
jgi:pyridoxine 5-phosphate synthase